MEIPSGLGYHTFSLLIKIYISPSSYMSAKSTKTAKHFCRSITAAIIAQLLLLVAINSVYADEIQINADSVETIAGDFRCKPCNRPIIYDADSLEMGSETLTTGDLYRYFASRGIRKLDRLSLQVDVDCCEEEDQAFQLNGLSFKITGDDDRILHEASLQDDTLLVDGAEISSFKPEAVLEFDLGYDFMQRFTSDSTDSIELSYVTPTVGSENAGMKPRFVVSEDLSSFSLSNIGVFVLFVGFWAIVFMAMNVFIKPKNEKTPSKPSNLVGS